MSGLACSVLWSGHEETLAMKNAAWGLLLGAMVFVSNACAHHEGPMEKAGRKTDDAAHDVKEGTKKAADDVKGD
jgi:hypothetical protein